MTPHNGPSHHLKISPSAKTKETFWGVGGSQLWEVARKNTVNKGRVVVSISVTALPIDQFLKI